MQLDAVEPRFDGITAAFTYSSITAAISDASSAPGVGMGYIPASSVYICVREGAMADGATGIASVCRLNGWATRPACMSCATIRPPAV